jgi:hypothetical protein
MSTLNQKIEDLKNKEQGSRGPITHSYQEQDVLRISSVEQVKNGKTKTILANRLFVVTGNSVKGDMIRGILLDNKEQLQNCIIAIPVNTTTKVGRYQDDGTVAYEIGNK